MTQSKTISTPAAEGKSQAERRMLENRALVEARRANNRLIASLAALLKPHGLAESQYNILRILRGAQPEGLCIQELASRMVAQAPDMTRLLDRLEEQSRIGREHGRQDRRMVQIRITPEGLELLARLDVPFEGWRGETFNALDRDELRTLGVLLMKVQA